MSAQNHRNFLQFLEDITNDISRACGCLRVSEDKIKVKIRMEQTGIVSQVLIKYPETNRYFSYDDQDSNIGMILHVWFMKDGNDYVPRDRLYRDLSYYYGRDPIWFELNTEWVKFSGSDSITVCGYKTFKI